MQVEVSWLEGSHLIEQIAERQASIEEDYDKICEVAPEFKRFSLEFFMWARMIVSSRNFGGQVEEGVKTSGLVPYADMLNHLRPRQTRWTFDNDSQVSVRAAEEKQQDGVPILCSSKCV